MGAPISDNIKMSEVSTAPGVDGTLFASSQKMQDAAAMIKRHPVTYLCNARVWRGYVTAGSAGYVTAGPADVLIPSSALATCPPGGHVSMSLLGISTSAGPMVTYPRRARGYIPPPDPGDT